jgi:DNA polymerase-1
MARVLLVDADILVYLIGSRNQVLGSWPHGDTVVHHAYTVEAKAWSDMENTLHELQERTDTTYMAVYLSDPSGAANWRKAVMPAYKANRSGATRPLIYHRLRELLMLDRYSATWAPTLEGDDMLGIAATTPGKDEIVIASTDKDMQTIPGLHYNWERHEQGVTRVSLEQADWNHFYQTLVGDRTDNYPGCPGMGPVGARKFLDKYGLDWRAVVKAFESKGLGEDEALQSAQVARILRYGEYNPTTGKVNLWEPNR